MRRSASRRVNHPKPLGRPRGATSGTWRASPRTRARPGAGRASSTSCRICATRSTASTQSRVRRLSWSPRSPWGSAARRRCSASFKRSLLAPLPYEQPGQLVRFYQQEPDKPATRQYLAGPHFASLRDHAASFEVGRGARQLPETGRDLVKDGQAQRLRVLRVTSDYFQTLRSGPLRGPGFDRRDEDRHSAEVVARSDVSAGARGVQRSQRSSVVGSTIQLSGEPYEVVGNRARRLRGSDRRRDGCVAPIRPRARYRSGEQLVDCRRRGCETASASSRPGRSSRA